MVKKFTLVPPLVLIAIILVLDILGSVRSLALPSFEPRYLAPLLNIIFIALMSFAVAFIAYRTYMAAAFFNVFFLGCGVLTLGFAALTTWFTRPFGINAEVTAYNISVAIAAFFHLAAAVTAYLDHRDIKKWARVTAIAAAAVFIALLNVLVAYAAVRRYFPAFFVPGTGPTIVRQFFMAFAVTGYLLSSLSAVQQQNVTKSSFFCWYSLSLALLGMGFLAVASQWAFGEPIAWAGRTAQWMGGVYMLVAVLDAARRVRSSDLPIRDAIDLFYRQAQLHYGDLFDTISDAIIAVDERDRILAWNESAETIFGHTAEEAVGKKVDDIVYTTDASFTETLMDLRAKRQPIKNRQLELMSCEGRSFPAEFSASIRTTREQSVVTLVITDITERKSAEEALRRSHDNLEQRVAERTAELARLAAAVENATEQIIVTDSVWNIDYVNPAFTRSTGYTLTEITGKEVRFLRSESTDPTLYDKARKAAKSGQPYAARFPIRKKDGTELIVECTISPVKQLSGEVTNFALVWRDVSEQLQLEERLRQSQKMEAVGTLAGGIAHDFNNMLAVILGNSELALDELDEKDGVKNYVEQIIKASKRARDLVKQILTFSRKAEQSKNLISLTPLLEEMFKLLRGTFPSTIQMELKIQTEKDSVIANPSQIQQVLMNLATNAAHAMREEGGTLTIGLSDITFTHKTVPDADMKAGTYIKIAVSDTGSGIRKEILPRIFEPFFTTKEAGQGTGMGLSVVYGIVKNHGGAVTVNTRVGQGSTFAVFLPCTPTISKAEQEEQSHLPRGTERILLVDDEPDLVQAVSQTLESLGYRVTTALNATDAWNKFENGQNNFDIVITDQTMPDLTGIRLAQRMLDVRKDLPIILFTGYSETATPQKAKEAGIAEFLMKPLEKREVAETIRKVLDRTQDA